MQLLRFTVCLGVLLCLSHVCICEEYYGTLVGELTTRAHQVSGKLYIVDQNRLRLRNFNYDGTGPDAFFYINDGANTGASGRIIPDEEGRSDRILGPYRDRDIILTLPQGDTTGSVTWFSVWCRAFSADFGSIQFPTNPRPVVPAAQSLGEMSRLAHATSSGTVTLLNTRRIRIENLRYDGLGPDAFFLVGTTDRPSATPGQYWKLPDENGSLAKANRYDRKTITLTLPPELTWFDVKWFSLYCIRFTQNFGHVEIPQPDDLTVPPIIDPQGMEYFGEYLGDLTTLAHGVTGKLYIVDEKRIRLRGFNYDGTAPDAHFWVGKRGEVRDNSVVSGEGTAIADEKGTMNKLGGYVDADVILTLPETISVSDIVWFSVWCRDVGVDFGHLIFPENLPIIPQAQIIGQLTDLSSGVSSANVEVLDTRTFRINSFSFDGNTPDTYFYAFVGDINLQNENYRLPDDMGRLTPLSAYVTQTINILLPPTVTVWDIDYLSVYSSSQQQSVGSVRLTNKFNMIVPPYISPVLTTSMENCESMHDYLNVGWTVDGDNIIIELTGALEENGYMAFGVSGSETSSLMLNADPTVVYYTDSGPVALDYYINAYSLCSAGNGVCPDTDNEGSNDVEVIGSNQRDGITTVRFRRPINKAVTTDKPYQRSGDTYVVWAMGVLNELQAVTKHNLRLTGNLKLAIDRAASDNCSPVKPRETQSYTPWAARRLSGMDTRTFRAVIGPAGGPRGYEGTTGKQPWGIAWYLNGLLIPELTLKRGDSYTFTVEGGTDPSNQARYHPFYITDDPIGGYKDKTEAQKQEVTVYAGENASAVGRYCEYVQPTSINPNGFATFDDYAEQLSLTCQEGNAGVLTWTPDQDTPDLVYYQCFTHNFLGWKIHIVDDYTAAAGAIYPSIPLCIVVVLAILQTLIL